MTNRRNASTRTITTMAMVHHFFAAATRKHPVRKVRVISRVEAGRVTRYASIRLED